MIEKKAAVRLLANLPVPGLLGIWLADIISGSGYRCIVPLLPMKVGKEQVLRLFIKRRLLGAMLTCRADL